MFADFYRLYSRGRAKLFTLLCRTSFGALGRNTTLCPPIRFFGVKRIRIGDGAFVGSNSWLQVVPEENGSSEPAIIIGDEVSVVGSCTITAVLFVSIEARVLMAGNVYISDHTHAH